MVLTPPPLPTPPRLPRAAGEHRAPSLSPCITSDAMVRCGILLQAAAVAAIVPLQHGAVAAIVPLQHGAVGAIVPSQHSCMSRTAPCEGRRRATVSLCEGGKRNVANILSELDEAVAASAADRAARLKTTQEKLAAEQAAASREAGKVSVFGARLDDDIAGDAVLNKPREAEHEILFTKGIALMQRGEYKLAVTAFTQATAAAPGGMAGRKGGQYTIYLAEALQAADRKKEAVGLLKRCEAHPDSDVRKIADNVLYIMQAPELKLDSDMFVTIPKLEEDDNWSYRKRGVEQKDPPPEKYSLEWYVLEAEKKQNSRREEPDQSGSMFAAAGVLATVIGLLVAT